MVGKNNAGKSNIIRALDIVLGEKWPTYREIGDKDFYRASSDTDPVDHFLVTVCLKGKVNTEVIEDEMGASVYPLNNEPIWEDYDDLMNEPGEREYKKGHKLRIFLDNAKEIWLYLLAPRNSRRGERVFGANILHQEGRWYRIQPLRPHIRDALLTTAFVPAFRDPSNQLRITPFTGYGRLIRHLYGQRTEEQNRNIEAARQELGRTLDAIFHHTTEALRDRLSRAIAHHRISFKAGAFTRDDDYKQITLFVDDGIDAPFYDKGSGIQSALIIALFAHYCDEFHKGGSLLLIEEPELYLHPQGRRAMEALLVEFAQPREGGSERQVIISTRSPEFLRSVPLHQITLVSKPPWTTASNVHQVPEGKIDEQDLRKIQRELRTKNAEMMFADHVILVEGGEEHLIPVLADLYFNSFRWLDFRNVSVVPVRGKGNFAIYTDILDEFGISWTLLADMDLLRDEVRKFLDKFHKMLPPNIPHKVERIRTAWHSLWDSSRQKEENYREIFEHCRNDIKEVVSALRQFGIFVQPHGNLECYLTEEAKSLEVRSKEIRAMLVAQKIEEGCKEWPEVTRWLEHVEDFEALLEHIRAQVEGNQDENQITASPLNAGDVG
ncbi:MAG: hypothetical protein DRG33_07175 [Deltaproteobacteria bacterium]|nr:MAG: hypothetical protein DRG33_07175 [Deltaproteobacteria bacterium]